MKALQYLNLVIPTVPGIVGSRRVLAVQAGVRKPMERLWKQPQTMAVRYRYEPVATKEAAIVQTNNNIAATRTVNDCPNFLR